MATVPRPALNAVDRLIGLVNPMAAVKRLQARQVLAYYEAAWLDSYTCDSTAVTCDTDWLPVDSEGDGSVRPWGAPRVNVQPDGMR